MKIKLTRTAGGHAAGDTIDVGRGAAEHLERIGYAETVRSQRRAAKDTATQDDSTTTTSKSKTDGVGDASPPPESPPTAG